MEKVFIRPAIFPYYAQAIEQLGFTKKYSLEKVGDVCSVSSDLSRRQIKRINRVADALKKSEEIGLPVLTREDVHSMRSGIIPESEKPFFEKAFL